MDPTTERPKEGTTITASLPQEACEPDVAQSQNSSATNECTVDDGSEAGTALLDLFSKSQFLLIWVGILLMSTINYLNVSCLFTFSVYALSEFSRASAEGTLNTVYGVVAIAIQGPLAVAVKEFHDFDVCLAIAVLAAIASAIEAVTPSFGGYIFGFALNTVAVMSARFLLLYLPAELSSLRYRTLALNISQVPTTISLLAGPPISEAILDNLGWRWGYGLFAILIPASNLLLLVMLFILRRRTVTRKGPTIASKATALRRELEKQDWIGIVLLAVGCALFLLPIPLETRGVDYYDTAAVITPTVIGALILIGFFTWEVRFAKVPLFDRRILMNPSILGCMATTVFIYASQQFTIVYMYTYVFVASSESISTASYISQVAGLTTPIFGLACGVWVSWAKRGKWSLITCTVMLIIGCVIQYVFIDPHAQRAAVIVAQTLLGFGWAGSLNALSISQSLTKKEDMPALTALFFILANFGGGVASSISGGLWTGLLLEYLVEFLPSTLKSHAAVIMGSIVNATSFTWGTLERDAIASAYRHSYRVQVVGCLICAIIAFVVCFPIKNIRLDIDHEHQMEEPASAPDKEKEVSAA